MRDGKGDGPPEGHLAVLRLNVAAVRAAAAAVAGTLGPKGLDTLLVDRRGDTVITNDGITILTLMDASHPAARLLVGAARAQEQEVGDGTTTASVLAAALLDAALEQVEAGVPASRVLEGMRHACQVARRAVSELAEPIRDMDDPRLAQVALVAARGSRETAGLVLAAARLWGLPRLMDPAARLADCVTAVARSEGEVYEGVLVRRGRADREAPAAVAPARVLVLDDALEPEPLEPEALGTEAGFRAYEARRAEHLAAVRRLLELDINLVVADRTVSDEALELFTAAGVMVLHRVSAAEWRRVAEHTGARVIRRSALARPPLELARALGAADMAGEDERLGLTRIIGGKGRPAATVLVGAATPEVLDERERIAKDAAHAVQAAVRGGVVPGGGAAELWAALAVERERTVSRGLAAYGVEAAARALRRPLWQIVANAGWSPLEKVGDAAAAQAEQRCGALGVDCETGLVADMRELGVTDPAPVKLHALKTAWEVAEAVLRIHFLFKMREPD